MNMSVMRWESRERKLNTSFAQRPIKTHTTPHLLRATPQSHSPPPPSSPPPPPPPSPPSSTSTETPPMATAPVKSPLHNFPPTFLKWASKNTNTHHHRCRRYPFDSPPPPPPPPPQPPSTPATDVEVQLENGIEGDNKPWNLRPRRASTCTSISTSSVMESSENLSKSTRLRGIEGHSGGEKRKFWIALSKDEIEEDIYSITGSKPSRRPRKRPRIVQKQLDNVFPGLWLNGLTPEAYRAFDLSSKT